MTSGFFSVNKAGFQGKLNNVIHHINGLRKQTKTQLPHRHRSIRQNPTCIPYKKNSANKEVEGKPPH